MGLFDNKQTKEEKKIYQALLSIKNDSYALKISLPKDEKEFLGYQRKEELITKYKFAVEMMNNVQLIQNLNIQNLGKCYDFVDEQYNRLSVRNGISMDIEVFMGHIRVVASQKKLENESIAALNQTQKQYNNTLDKTEDFVLDMEGRLSQMSQTPGHTRSMDVASNMARELLNDLGLSNEELNNMVIFNNKFPQYRKLADYLLDSKRNTSHTSFYSTIDAYSMQCKKKYPNFSSEDLLIPYMLEKYYMGIQLNEKEMQLVTKALEDASAIEKIDFYIKVNAVIFGDPNLAVASFLNLFENCNKKHLYPAGLRIPINDSSTVDATQEYGSNRPKR